MTAIAVSVTHSNASAPRRRFPFLIVARLLPMTIVNFVAFILPVIRLGMISFIENRSGGVLTDNYTFNN